MINRLKITNFKSIDSLEIKNIRPFSVFSGPNGAGKSNFFDALGFVSHFMQSGLDSALRAQGGFQNLRSQKNPSDPFQFEIDCDLPDPDKGETPNQYQYKLVIHEMDGAPQIEESLLIDGASIFLRNKHEISIFDNESEKLSLKFSVKNTDALSGNVKDNLVIDFNKLINHFALKLPNSFLSLLFQPFPIVKLLRDFRLYRIDPFKAKEPATPSIDPSRLSRHAHNLASVLKRIENDDDKRQTIIEWMEAIVPGIESVKTQEDRLDGTTTLLFEESGSDKQFPARMMSDGTVYALSLLVAVLDQAQNFGLTMIEEPERGLHPKVIFELVGLMREQASSSHPIWLTTHSESVIRVLKPEELILVDKVGGGTGMKHANEGGLTVEQLSPLNLDEAWLSDLLNGGVPW